MPEAPDPPELKEARALWLAQRIPEALAKFDSVLTAFPEHPLALLDGARAFGASYQIAKAEQLLDRYLLAAGKSAKTLTLAARSYRMISRGVKARECYLEALSSGPLDPVSALELALLLDRSGDRNAASTLLEDALARDPGFTEGHYFYAKLSVREGRSHEAIPILSRQVENVRLPVFLRTRAAYALAEAADKAGDPEEAIRHAARAKAFGEEDAPPMREIARLIRAQGDQLQKTFSRGLLETWQKGERRAADRTDPPLCLLTGSPRSGTTLLEKILDAHPGIVTSDEHDLFARFTAPSLLHPNGVPSKHAGEKLAAIQPHLALRKRVEYLDGMEELIGEPIAGRVLIDKNPSLTELIPVWLRMAPRSKILIMLRDPRDVVLSCYLNDLPLNAYTVDFLTLQQTARRYVREMESWLRLRDSIPDGQWREVRYEDCVADLPATARGVLEWLGLGWSEEVSCYRDHLKRRMTVSPTYADVTQPIHRKAIGRWHRYERQLESIQSILAPLVREFGY